MSHRLLPLPVALLGCLTLAFSGCGDDEGTEVAQTPPAASSPAPASSPAADEGGQDSGESYGGESYGGESYGGESSGGKSSGSDDGESGGGGYNGGYSGGYEGGEGEGEEMGGYGGGYNGGYGGEGGEGEGEEMGGYNGGYGGGGKGPAMTGAGGGGGGYGSDGDEGYGGSYAGGMGGSGYGGSGYGGGAGGPGLGAPGLGGPGMGGPAMGGPPAMTFAGINQFMMQNCSMCHMRGQAKGNVSLASVTSDVSDNTELWETVAGVLESGSMPPTGRRQPPPQQKQAVVEWIQTQIRESADARKNLLGTSQQKFANGKEAEAIKLMYAHLVSAPSETANEQLAKVGFYMRGRRPVTTLRFAVAVVLDAPETLTDIKPIGSPQFGGGGGGGGPAGGGYGGGAYGGGYGGGRGNQAQETELRSFESLTGELGERVVSELQSRWAEGKYGNLFNEVSVAVAAPAAGGSGGGGMYGGGGYGEGMYGGGEGGGGEGYGGGGYGGGSGGPGASAPSLGMGGPGASAPSLGMGGGPGMGAPALGGPGMGGPAMGGLGGPGMGQESKPQGSTMPGRSIAAGMVYLGDGSRKDIEEKFAASGADVLVLFDVDAQVNNRTKFVTNKTAVRMIDSAGDTVGSTRSLTNTEVEKNRIRGKDDEVDKQIERLFTLADKEVTVIPMPTAMQASHAQSRMATILSDDSISPLRKMFEARLYNSMNLLSGQELSMVYQIVMDGNEGEALAGGSDADRQFVIQNALDNLIAL